MRLGLFLSLIFLASCSVGPDKSEKEVYARDIMWAPNDCQSKFVTTFDNVGLVFAPLNKNIEFSLQVASENGSNKTRAFAEKKEECTALHKVVTPFLFNELRGLIKNDLSLKILSERPEESLEPGVEIPLDISNVELVMKHQLVNAGNEKNTNTAVRTSNIPGSIKCSKPFMLSCGPSRKENTCGPLVLNPPDGECELSFPNVSVRVSLTATLKGNLGGKLSFQSFESDQKATMTIEQVDSLALVKDQGK